MSSEPQVATNSELANGSFFARWSERHKNRSDRKRQERAERLWALQKHNQEIVIFEKSQICRCGVSLHRHEKWQRKARLLPFNKIGYSCPAFILDPTATKEKQ
jgi:hypothetical protein